MPTILTAITIVACIFCLSKAMNIIPVGLLMQHFGGLTIQLSLCLVFLNIIKYQILWNNWFSFNYFGVILVKYSW